jgi:hypothetical protein
MSSRDGGFVAASFFMRTQNIATPGSSPNISTAAMAPRFCGTLGVARAIGDFVVPHPICGDPEIRILGGCMFKVENYEIEVYFIFFPFLYSAIQNGVYPCCFHPLVRREG